MQRRQARRILARLPDGGYVLESPPLTLREIAKMVAGIAILTLILYGVAFGAALL